VKGDPLIVPEKALATVISGIVAPNAPVALFYTADLHENGIWNKNSRILTSQQIQLHSCGGG
jgi:hypothetical protein